MGAESTRLQENGFDKNAMKAIDNIYAMFQQSNAVVLQTLKQKNPGLTKSRIKNIESVVDQLLEPFKENEKYSWSQQIYTKFKKHFTSNFEPLWTASREQFYELLLINCKINLSELKKENQSSLAYQNIFYSISAEQIEQKIADTFIGDINSSELKRNVERLSMLAEQTGVVFSNKCFSQMNISQLDEMLSKRSSQTTGVVNKQSEVVIKRIREHIGRIRVESSSLILPQTLFLHKMSLASQEQFYDLLKFYRQFSNTLQQIICSNNLISCPIKNFIISLEEKINRKKIRTEGVKKQELLSNVEESRKVRKTRETNNDIILYEIRAFLEAYTEFVWMFLQLHLMEDSNLGKIVQPEVLFGIIFKHLWTFVDWISDRGYEFEEAQLEQYFDKKSHHYLSKISEERLKIFLNLIEELRGEKHPQQYLKKIVVFYRQVSKDCQNADDLLTIYQQVIKHCAWQKGIRDLRLFRMRNIIQKLLKVEESSLSGGEITYSWTTWCILIELLKEKVNYKYGTLIISKQASEAALKLRESQLSWEELKMNQHKGSFEKKKGEQEGCCGSGEKQKGQS